MMKFVAGIFWPCQSPARACTVRPIQATAATRATLISQVLAQYFTGLSFALCPKTVDVQRRGIATSRQVGEQSLRFDEVRRVEPFGKPATDGCKQIAGFVGPALVAQQPDEPGRGA